MLDYFELDSSSYVRIQVLLYMNDREKYYFVSHKVAHICTVLTEHLA